MRNNWSRVLAALLSAASGVGAAHAGDALALLPPTNDSLAPLELCRSVSWISETEPVEPDFEARLDQIEAEWTAMKQRYETGQPEDDVPLFPAGGPDCRPGRFLAGAEISFLKPRFEDGAEEDYDRRLFDFRLDAAPRIWLAAVNSSGFGIRARYWQYANRSGNTATHHVPLAGLWETMTIESHTVDVELTQEIDFCFWRFTIGAGARYASLEQVAISLDAPDAFYKAYGAAGPTISLDTRRPFGDLGFAWVANLRGSLLTGEARWGNATGQQTTDDIGTILEMQIGAEWSRQWGALGTVTARAVWEQQTWLGAGTFFGGAGAAAAGKFEIQPDDHDIAFMGFGFALELAR